MHSVSFESGRGSKTTQDRSSAGQASQPCVLHEFLDLDLGVKGQVVGTVGHAGAWLSELWEQFGLHAETRFGQEQVEDVHLARGKACERRFGWVSAPLFLLPWHTGRS